MIQKLLTRQWITIWGDIHQFKFADEVWIESAYIYCIFVKPFYSLYG